MYNKSIIVGGKQNDRTGKKRQVAKISVFITSIFVIFLSISYAFINQTLAGTKRQVITSGNLELELKEGNAITLDNELPMYDEVGMIQNPFTFSVTNKTDKDTNYTLKLVDVTPDSIQKLDASVVKYGLEKDGTKSIALLSKLKDGVLDTGKISGNGTIHYTLRLWIDSSVEDENLVRGKSLSYRIDVVSEQIKDAVYKGMIKKTIPINYDDTRGPSCSSDDDSGYCDYLTGITAVVFENTIHIPTDGTALTSWDDSVLGDGSVMAYIEESGTTNWGTPGYKLHIQGNGKIYANVDSSHMFEVFVTLKSITGLDNLDTSQVTNMSSMFSRLTRDYPFEELNLSSFDTSNVTDMSSMFEGYSGSLLLDLSHFNTSKVTDMSNMFSFYSGSEPLDLSSFDTSNVVDMSHMFWRYSSSQPLNLSSFDTSNVTDMSDMFHNYSSSQPLDLSHFDTSNVTDMSGMFSSYSSDQLLDLSSFDTSNVINMSSMFYDYNSNQPLNLNSLDTSKVTNMSSMFYDYSSNQPLNLNSLDTSKVTNMSQMFSHYSSNQPLNLSSLDTSNVTDMSHMFWRYSSSQPLNLSSFDTLNVTNMFGMFDDYSSEASLDISGFDTSKVTSMSNMFYRSSTYYGSPILVKDEAMKAWVLEQNSDLTNVTVKVAG